MTKDQLRSTLRATIFVPRAIAFATCATLFASFAARADAPRANFLRYEIVATLPHDARDFTQGLAYVDGNLLESSGLYRHSALWLKKIASGKVVRKKQLDLSLFGEG